MAFRDPSKDQLKNEADQRRIITKNLTCKHDDCNKSITIFKGPGEHDYCREHQIQTVPYGGMGRVGADHTFHRKGTCDVCGYDPDEDPRWEIWNAQWEDEHHCPMPEEVRHRLKRTLIHGDHIVRKADGGKDIKENIGSVCFACHAVKSIVHKDTERRGTS